jgi:branched-chain amino acid transport system permease protein
MLFGLAVGGPTLRLRGDYLAIVTLGFGEMMRVFLITADRLTGGPNGILGIARPHLLGREFSDPAFYWLTLAFVLATTAVSGRLNRSRVGRAWMAMREDETAARAMGLDITRLRLLAFSLSALWAGLCGAFFAAHQQFVSPESFTFNESVSVLAMVVLGGMGSIPGVIAGAVILGLLPEVLRGVAEYRMIALSGLMIAMMIFRPQGLFPDVRRKLELKEERRPA